MSSPLPQLGPYQTLGVLGEGGMGTVYLARHPALGTELAIKVLLAARGASEAQRKRFRREAQALGRLHHPGLVEIVDAGETAGVPWIAMRRIAGGSLEARIKEQGVLAPAEVVRLGVQLCEALSAAHAQGILHRDLKPDNVLCTDEGRYVVTDFGLTKDLSNESVRLSQTGALQGTPGYWAPEQASGQGKESTPRTDVYGVGAVLYSALTGLPPLQGEGLMELIVTTLEQPPTPPSAIVAVPTDLERVVLRCLAKSPDDRYDSLADLSAALQTVSLSEARSGGHLLPLALAGLAALAFLGGALAWAAQRKPAETSPTPTPSLAPTRTPTPTPGAPPEWYSLLPAESRPALPLPARIQFGAQSGEYVNEVDESVLVWVPAGQFVMGTQDGENDETPERRVTFEQGFFLGKFEVTWRQYAAFCKATDRNAPEPRMKTGDLAPGSKPIPQSLDHPAVRISWDHATNYCRWAGLRLPTEAEWEYAARGPEGHEFPWGPEPPSGERANLADQSAEWEWTAQTEKLLGAKVEWKDGFACSAPVRSFPKGVSWVGCHHMSGNVLEWVQDTYMPAYFDPGHRMAPRDGSAWEIPDRSERVARGGSWYFPARFARAAYRWRFKPGYRETTLGMRVARSSP